MKPLRSAMEEFRRWLLVITAVSVLGTVALHFAFQFSSWPPTLIICGAFAGLWACLGAVESWLLFPRRWRRAGWTAASAATGAILVVHPLPAWPFVIVGACEALLCLRTRRWPAAWLLATPLLYATLNTWNNATTAAAGRFFEALRAALPALPSIFDEIGDTTLTLFLILLVRAAIACFLCPAKLVPGGRIELPTKGL